MSNWRFFSDLVADSLAKTADALNDLQMLDRAWHEQVRGAQHSAKRYHQILAIRARFDALRERVRAYYRGLEQ